MNFALNTQSRLFYDKDETRMHIVNSEKPLKYISEFSQAKYFNNIPMNVEVDNQLRSQPTRLNEPDDVPYTSLYGTAPLKLRTGPIDTESGLIHGDTNSARCGKHTVEEHTFFENNIKVPTEVYPVMVENTARGGSSTRNMYKNTQILSHR